MCKNFFLSVLNFIIKSNCVQQLRTTHFASWSSDLDFQRCPIKIFPKLTNEVKFLCLYQCFTCKAKYCKCLDYISYSNSKKGKNTFSVFKSLASHFRFRLRKSKLKKMDRNGGASSSSLSYPSPRNGIGPSPRGSNGYSQDSIIKPEMCYYCFDVLYCHLYQLDPPRVPMFTNSSQ